MTIIHVKLSEKSVCMCCESIMQAGEFVYVNDQHRGYMCSPCKVLLEANVDRAHEQTVAQRRHPSFGWDEFEERSRLVRRLASHDRVSLLHESALSIMGDKPGMSYAEAACLASQVEGVYDDHRGESYIEVPPS